VAADQARGAPSIALDARALARALAGFRIFFGVILFSNGLAKLLSFTEVFVGPYKATLIDRPEARAILDFEINRRGGDGTDLPLLKSIVNDVVLDQWDLFQWVTTALELGAGLALMLGIASRGAALLGLSQQLFLQLVYFSSARFMWEQPHEWVPLVILALVPSGRVWGYDHRLVHRGLPRHGGWPF
jgi:uncharacterized membrane protein YphA (DoxX/SURF4 family)